MTEIAPGTHKPPGTRVPGYPGPNTRRVTGPTRTRMGSYRSGYYPSGTRVVDERGTTSIRRIPSRAPPTCVWTNRLVLD